MYISLNISVILRQEPSVLIEEKATAGCGKGEDTSVGRNITIDDYELALVPGDSS